MRIMIKHKFSSGMLPLLLTLLSCEQDSSAIIETQPGVQAKKTPETSPTPVYLDLSLPDNLFDTTTIQALTEPDNNSPVNINSILSRKTESIYSFSGDLYLLQDENDALEMPLLEKIDGGRIDMQIKFEQP